MDGEVKEQGSASFLKKRSKKLLRPAAMGVGAATAHGRKFKKFFCFFLFTKRSSSL
jgi:hypothetical protein